MTSVLVKEVRPHDVPGVTVRVKTGCGNLYVTVSYVVPKVPFEIFAVLGKSGGCASCQNEAITRTVSQGLRYGVPAFEYVRMLKGIRCLSPMFQDGGGGMILSCPDAVGQVLDKFMNGGYENGSDESRSRKNPGDNEARSGSSD